MSNAEKHERTIGELQSDLEARQLSSLELVEIYLARIAALDTNLNSVISVNPDARTDAATLDGERRSNGPRGPLHGIPILVKDNIETADAMPTTAGSLALVDNHTGRDAPCIARLRRAGAIVLGKTNLSEWANIRSSRSLSGWSAVGGLTRNPHVLDRTTSGSSSGSAAAIAASLAAAALGTETDGSITSPAEVCGIVGLKPTVGLVSRTHIVPISASQDTAGPMTRSVRDAALLLSMMAGRDRADSATHSADKKRSDYVAALLDTALSGATLGIWRPRRATTSTLAVFDTTLEVIASRGARLVPLNDFRVPRKLAALEMQVLLTELKAGLNTYLGTAAATVKTRTLADVIAFNRQSARELTLFGQDFFETAEAGLGVPDPAYRKARSASRRMARFALDRAFAKDTLDAIVTVTGGPAWRVDMIRGDDTSGTGSTTLPAVAGYPHLTVPMGQVLGLPVGISFIGRAWEEARLLSLGYAFECAAAVSLRPQFLPSLEGVAEAAFARADPPHSH